jgi:DNA-binding NarL/FixJ family response regulator
MNPRARPTPGRSRIRVLIADDHRTFAESLRLALRAERGIEVTGVCHDGLEVIEAVQRKRPDIILMDVQMPVMDGVAATRAVSEAAPGTSVLALTGHDDEEAKARAVDAGAVGFLSKSMPLKDLARRVRAAARGEQLVDPAEARRLAGILRKRRQGTAGLADRVRRLSPRETEILQLMAEGKAPLDIARTLAISHHTLRTHVQNILFKLKVHSKVEALAAAIRFGKVTPNGRS